MTSPHSCHVKARYIVLSRVPTVDLVSDPPTQPSKSSRDAEPSSDSAASVMLHPLHGTNSLPHHLDLISDTGLFTLRSKLN